MIEFAYLGFQLVPFNLQGLPLSVLNLFGGEQVIVNVVKSLVLLGPLRIVGSSLDIGAPCVKTSHLSKSSIPKNFSRFKHVATRLL